MAIFDFVAATLKAKRNKSPRATCLEARYLIIRLPSSQFIYRFMLLAFIIKSFPTSSSSTPIHAQRNYRDMSSLFRDLTNEGLMKKPQGNTVVLSDHINEAESQVLADYDMELVHLNDVEKQNSVMDNSVDFIFTVDFPAASKFIERTLKPNGVVAVLMNDNPSSAFYLPPNCKIVYMRRFNVVSLAIKKTGEAGNNNDNNNAAFSAKLLMTAPRKLCSYSSEAKKAALQKLEDVLLEPPRAASGKSRKYLKRTRYLPDLMGDSLESYPRRVFIDAGLAEKEGGSRSDWFVKNYPTRNKDFEMYKIETVASEESVAQIGMSGWLRKNVKEEEYVVMKAEAEVVEEMMRSDSVGLVDELFLECKPKQGANKLGIGRSRRAYWECLALYGKLRDEGVAVHQWWG